MCWCDALTRRVGVVGWFGMFTATLPAPDVNNSTAATYRPSTSPYLIKLKFNGLLQLVDWGPIDIVE